MSPHRWRPLTLSRNSLYMFCFYVVFLFITTKMHEVDQRDEAPSNKKMMFMLYFDIRVVVSSCKPYLWVFVSLFWI